MRPKLTASPVAYSECHQARSTSRSAPLWFRHRNVWKSPKTALVMRVPWSTWVIWVSMPQSFHIWEISSVVVLLKGSFVVPSSTVPGSSSRPHRARPASGS